MLPYASSPGIDFGIAGDDYAWLLRQCKAKADWQLHFRISFAGRLTKCVQPSFEHRRRPAYSYALGHMPYIGDGRSLGGQTTTGESTHTREHVLSAALLLTVMNLSMFVGLPLATSARGRSHYVRNQNGSSTISMCKRLGGRLTKTHLTNAALRQCLLWRKI